MRIKYGWYEMIICMLVYLLISFLGSVALLALVAFLLLKLQISAQAVSVMMIGIYILMPFVGGWLMGRKMGEKKYIYGALMGTVYFIVLCFFSMVYRGDASFVMSGWLTTATLCVGGGMLGGMLG